MVLFVEGCKFDGELGFIVRDPQGKVLFASHNISKVTDYLQDTFSK